MTKERLSDLLKEEVNKAEAPDNVANPKAAADESSDQAQTPAAASPKPAASRRTKRSTASTRRTATSRQPAKATSNATTTPEAAKAAAKEPPQAGIASPISSDPELTQQVSALEKALAAAQKDNAKLEKTVVSLQKDLETQQGRLFELKDSLAQTEAAAAAKTEALAKTQAELDEAKKTILKLSEVPAPSAPPAPSRISGVDILPRRPVEAKARPGYKRGVPDYAIQKGQPNPMLTDADIGWVD